MGRVVDNFVNVSVQDDSVLAPSDEPVLSVMAAIQPFFSAKGRDNQILLKQRPGAFEDEYGEDYENVDKYGYGALIAHHVLEGGGAVHACRLMPEDAKAASKVFCIGTKVVTGTVDKYERNADHSYKYDQDGNLIVTSTGDGIEVGVVVKEYDDEVDNSVVDTTDANWDTVYPLFAFNYWGRGICGNDFGFTIERDGERDGEVEDGRRYKLDIFYRDSNGMIQEFLNESIYFSFNPVAEFTPGSSHYENLEFAYGNNSEEKPFDIEVYPGNYDVLTDLLMPYMATNYGEADTKHDIDFIFGKDIENNQVYESVRLGATTIDVDDQIVFLSGGTDGSLGLGNTVDDGMGGTVVVDENHIKNTKEALLVDFYKARIDVNLVDERLVDGAVTFTAGWGSTINLQIVQDMNYIRPDVSVIVDGGLEPIKSAKASIALCAMTDVVIPADEGYNVGVFPLTGISTDRAKNIRVPSTYEIAYSLFKLYKQVGNYRMLAGYKSGEIQTMKFDWLPRKTVDDTEIGPMQKAKAIFAVKLEREGPISIMSDANMYGIKYSKFCSLRNGLIIGDAIRLCKRVLIRHTFTESTATDMLENAQTALDVALGSRGYPDSIEASATAFQTTRDKSLESASAKLEITFPNVAQKWSVVVHGKRRA